VTILQLDAVVVVTAVKRRLKRMDAHTFRFPGIAMSFLYLPDHARIHMLTAPFGLTGLTKQGFNWPSSSVSRRARAKNKNSTPAHSPEVLSATYAVCCHLIHGQDSNRSEPWADRRDAADY
jgi:hypothetical protein